MYSCNTVCIAKILESFLLNLPAEEGFDSSFMNVIWIVFMTSVHILFMYLDSVGEICKTVQKYMKKSNGLKELPLAYGSEEPTCILSRCMFSWQTKALIFFVAVTALQLL